jgi:diguanylate cyclase (GGDEF)-like protein/PAS domain S-box-containing protein
MVIDDVGDSLNLLATLLKQNGYRVRPADSGELALASLKLRKPDLVLLDVRMPGMDGFEVCERIKADPDTADIPVIFITALNDTSDKVKGFQLGGADFITKPYQEEEVLSRVKSQLEMLALRRELEQSNRNLHNERELLKTTLLSIGDGVICTDGKGIITMINDVARNLTGWHKDSALGEEFLTVFHIVNERTRELAFDPVAKVIETGQVIGLANHTTLISKEGIERPIADSAAPILDIEGNAVGVVLVFRDVTNETMHLNEIEFLSFHDHLTGLYNRRYLEEEMARLDVPRRLPITLVMGDLNGLKMTNDAFGHAAGDELLKQTTKVLKHCFRQDDIICRYGGDEFVAVLPNADSKTAEAIIARVLTEITQMQSDKGILSISFGWDTKYEEAQSLTEVLKNAEDFMYKRKMLESPSVRNATINTIIKTLYEKNSREEAHSKRVSELSARIGYAISLSESEINKLRTTGLLHDIGKILVPDAVLEKPSKLTEEEWAEIKRHPETGYRILNGSAELIELAETVLQHHERWDGTGYPKGLSSEDIQIYARIIAIADAYDAMTSKRPYRDEMSPEAAIAELKRCADVQFDPKIVNSLDETVFRNV